MDLEVYEALNEAVTALNGEWAKPGLTKPEQAVIYAMLRGLKEVREEEYERLTNPLTGKANPTQREEPR